MVLCNYAYRSVPFGVQEVNHHKYQDGSAADPVPGVKPRIYARVGQPLFRSLRELGSRAVVSDTFAKTNSFHDFLGQNVRDDYGSEISVSHKFAGASIKARRAGYNVLYGDGHVAWFGDPGQSVIWHTQGRSGRFYNVSYTDLGKNYGFCCRTFYTRSKPTVNDDWFPPSPHAVWHEFDGANTVDVGADDN